MALFDFNSLLVLVEPEGDDARAAFQYSENAAYRRFGRAGDALIDYDDDTASEFDLGLRLISSDSPTRVHLALGFNPGPRNLSKGFVFGSDPETCDVLLTKDKTSGVSGNHFSINVDWSTLQPLITCLTPNDGAGIRILSDNVWSLKLQAESEMIEQGTAITIRIFDSMDFVVHCPHRNSWEVKEYSHNVVKYVRRCQDADLEMARLRLSFDPTPVFVSLSQGLTGMGYSPLETIVGKEVVFCVAKSREKFPVDPQIFMIKRFLHVRKTWDNHARIFLSQLRGLQHRYITAPVDIISNGHEYMPAYLAEPPVTLTERLNKGSLGERDAGEILGQVFEGLRFLHANGIVHGGLCPQSIRIASFTPWSIKLSDIGLHPQVRLPDAEERELYLNEVSDPCHIPVPTGDIWSAGVVGLRVAWPDGFPKPSIHWPNEKNKAKWSPLQWFRFQSEWKQMVTNQTAALYYETDHSERGKKDVASFLTHVFTFTETITAESCLKEAWIRRWHLPLSHGQDEQNLDYFNYPLLCIPTNGSGVPLAEPSGPSGGGLVYKEAEDQEGGDEEKETEESKDEEDSGEDTETGKPRSSISKGKQPESRHASVDFFSQQPQQSATPATVDPQALQAKPREVGESTVASSGCVCASRKRSIGPTSNEKPVQRPRKSNQTRGSRGRGSRGS